MIKLLSFLLLLFCSLVTVAQNFVVSGIIKDASSGESLVNATVFHRISSAGVISNEYGFYRFTLPKGTHTLEFSYLGYQKFIFEIDLKSDTSVNIEMESSLRLSEVTVSDDSPMATVRSAQMSSIKINADKVSSIPVIFGEADILKTLQLLPGVSGGQEGFSGIYVRGGGPDQNLFLLDGVPVYSTSHLLGLFSVFNNDAIKDVNLIKGGFPARYGGRLSSVVDIRMKEGNMREFHGEGSIGLISSKLMLEGPIIKDKTSFMVSGRRTYYDVLMAPFIAAENKRNDETNLDLSLYFYDLNVKVNHQLSDQDHLYLSAYLGRDIFKTDISDNFDNQDDYDEYGNEMTGSDRPLIKYENSTNLKFLWGNITTAARWNHVFSNQLFSNATFTFSDYTFETGIGASYTETSDDEKYMENYGLSYSSKISDLGLKYDLDYLPNNDHFVRFGLGITEHKFSPGVTGIFAQNNDPSSVIDTSFGRNNIPAEELSIYAEDQWTISPKLRLNAGLHYSAFYTQKKYYHSLQPRISASYMIKENVSVKASFVSMTQYLNLLANSTMNLPTDLWVPATANIQPQKSWQAALGTAYSLNNTYQIELETFYKNMNHLVEYKEGASFFSFSGDFDDKITQGKGKSYGLEFLIKKNTGKLTGWLGYTWSKSERSFDELNAGRTFPFKYDRRHDLSLVLSQKLNKTWDFGLVWVFNTGNAFTLKDESFASITQRSSSDGFYQNDPNNVNQFTDYFASRNNYRMPNYHRLDLSANHHFEGKKGTHTLSAGVYNTYVHQNAMFVYASEEYNYETGESEPVIQQVSLLNFLPFIRYAYKF